MSPDAPQPWEQKDGESAPAFAAFRLYRDLGPAHRSVDAVAARLRRGPREGPGKAPRRAPGQIKLWARRFEWVARAAAWDARVDEERRAAALKAERDRAARWVERRAEVTQTEYLFGGRMLVEADRILRGRELQVGEGLPPVQEPVTPIDLRRAGVVVRLATDLMRRAVETETGRPMEPPPPDPRTAPPDPNYVPVSFVEVRRSPGRPPYIEVEVDRGAGGGHPGPPREVQDPAAKPATPPPPPGCVLAPPPVPPGGVDDRWPL